MQNIFSRITWRPSRKLIVSLGIVCLILGGVYIWASRYIDAIRLNNIRNDYLASYAGCEMKILNPEDREPKGSYATMASVTEYTNKNWKADSQEWHFTHADVVEYMMKRCPPKSDAQIEKVYSGNPKESIQGWKRSRDYKLKFISKDLDVFRQ
jgi:hypothetical protein